jgi:hypothetical protein
LLGLPHGHVGVGPLEVLVGGHQVVRMISPPLGVRSFPLLLGRRAVRWWLTGVNQVTVFRFLPATHYLLSLLRSCLVAVRVHILLRTAGVFIGHVIAVSMLLRDGRDAHARAWFVLLFPRGIIVRWVLLFG